jgi:hypothetical protein
MRDGLIWRSALGRQAQARPENLPAVPMAGQLGDLTDGLDGYFGYSGDNWGQILVNCVL